MSSIPHLPVRATATVIGSLLTLLALFSTGCELYFPSSTQFYFPKDAQNGLPTDLAMITREGPFEVPGFKAYDHDPDRYASVELIERDATTPNIYVSARISKINGKGSRLKPYYGFPLYMAPGHYEITVRVQGYRPIYEVGQWSRYANVYPTVTLDAKPGKVYVLHVEAELIENSIVAAASIRER